MTNSETGATVSPPTMTPTITGNSAVDALLRNAIIASSAAIAAIIVTWLNAHGFSDPNLNLLISGAVASSLFAVAGIVWGFMMAKASQRAIINNTIHAAVTGEVSQAVIAKATPDQIKAVEASPVASVSKT